ncbi:GyrI-like domain-containing protein [Enterococcus hulanensis]|uniref:GyrI-like domain-containing protein n=1 Tax=Enterococcus hulanensis TaxID=2559929 RepID=UPI001A8C1276|nr:GyrI-like domain-containing protein [Enterococcus hulanensis]MBO0459408.1 GyrI-like domain-containing protein [Enterococcus hulanensis]
MKYKVEARVIESFQVAFMKYEGKIAEANEFFPSVFKSVRGKSNGAPLFNFLKINSEKKEGIMELCVPTSELPIGNAIRTKKMKSFRAICTTHIGSYDTLQNAYHAMYEFAQKNKVALSVTGIREVYIKGPGMFLKGNPDKYITEIQIPVVEK